jgi:hypothetical protein
MTLSDPRRSSPAALRNRRSSGNPSSIQCFTAPVSSTHQRSGSSSELMPRPNVGPS